MGNMYKEMILWNKYMEESITGIIDREVSFEDWKKNNDGRRGHDQ